MEERLAPAAGMLDPTFSVDGRATAAFAVANNDIAVSTAIDSQGRVIVAGYSSAPVPVSAVEVARYAPDGTLDLSFGIEGKIVYSNLPTVSAVAVDALDRVILVGASFSQIQMEVWRLTTAGSLDSTFSGDGKSTVTFNGNPQIATSVAVDSLNRIVVAGTTTFAGNSDFAIARLTVAGVLDTSFDGDGKALVNFGSNVDQALGVAVDSLNRVVVAGSSRIGTTDDIAVARLTVGGAPDTSFDGDGRTSFAIGSFDDVAHGVAVDSLDRVVVAGRTFNGANEDFVVARLTAAGTLDSAFDGDGKKSFGFDTALDIATSVAVDSLDRVISAGYAQIGSSTDFAVARLTASGALDSDFDGDGQVSIAFGSSTDTCNAVTVDALNRVVVAGSSVIGTNNDFAVARLTVTGSLDVQFELDGRVLTDFRIGSSDGTNVAIDSLGRIVVAGSAAGDGNTDFAVVRFLPSGILDATFGIGGTMRIDFGGSEAAYDVCTDSLDRVVVAGYFYSGSDYEFAVARLSPTGSFDTSFSGDGSHTFGFGTVFDFGYGVAVDSLDRIIIVGEASVSTNPDFAVARLTTAGELDPTFSVDGKTTIAFGTTDDFAYGVAIDSQDRILVAGLASIGGDGEFAVARLTVAGELDGGFDFDGKLTFGFGTPAEGGFCVAVDSLDRVIVGGYSLGMQYDFAVARVTDTGALDPSFDGDGKVRFAIGSAHDLAYAVTVDRLDRVILAGNAQNGAVYDFAVARLKTDGTLDNEFDSDGKVIFTFPFTSSRNDQTVGVAIDSAGRVIVAGGAYSFGPQMSVARLTGDTITATAQVNDGSVQRSRVTSLTVQFSGQVTFAGKPVQAFTLLRAGGGAVTFSANVTVENGGTVVTLSNFSGNETEWGSLLDGRYTLTTLASQISAGGQSLDGDANGTAGGNFVFGDAQGLFRFFGDINGDRRVDIADFGVFALTFMNEANYIGAFDFNGDGRIDIVDFGQFSLRYFTTLP